LESGLPRQLERLLVARARLFLTGALLEPIVPGDDEPMDSLTRPVALHKRSLTSHIFVTQTMEAAVQPDSRLRVLIADDHRLFAEALQAILDADARIDVVGHAGDGQEAVQLAKQLHPQVVLMDISMPVMDGHEAASA